MVIADILGSRIDSKPTSLVTCEVDETVEAAIASMANNDVGAVVVSADGHVAGVFSERDVVKGMNTAGGDFLARRLRDVMTDNVLVATPDDTVDDALSVMKENRIRHLPVVADDKLVGIVSLRDLSLCKIDQVSNKVNFLKNQVHILHRPLPM